MTKVNIKATQIVYTASGIGMRILLAFFNQKSLFINKTPELLLDFSVFFSCCKVFRITINFSTLTIVSAHTWCIMYIFCKVKVINKIIFHLLLLPFPYYSSTESFSVTCNTHTYTLNVTIVSTFNRKSVKLLQLFCLESIIKALCTRTQECSVYLCI